MLARLDDGTPILAQRTTGGGRVLVWTSTFDNEWSDLPLHPVFLPLLREIVQFAGARRESVPFFTVGQPLDPRFVLIEAGLFEEGTPQAGEEEGAGEPGPALGLLVGPDGSALELAADGGALLQLASPGFYEVREEEEGETEWVLAVNPDVREADAARIDPEELTLAVAPESGAEGAAAGVTLAGGDLSQVIDPEATLEDGERRQGAWRFLLAAAILLLLGETLLAGRKKPLAKQAG